MLVEQVRKLKPIDRLLYWINERYRVFQFKQAGKDKPWTDDKVIQNVYFTCPYREDDKTTAWLRDNIREPLRNQPEVIFATIAFRWFNLIETGEQLLKYPGKTTISSKRYGAFVDWNLAAVKSRLHGIQEHGGKVFTGAFNISNSGSTKPKIDRVCDDYIQPVWLQREQLCKQLGDCGTLEEAHKILRELPGLGGSGFMAAQIVCDLKYTYVLENAEDWWTWCSPGPGSKRGLNRLLERPIDSIFSKEEWRLEISKLQIIVNKSLRKMPKFHAQDLQNCLCEMDKYIRVLFNEGQSKRKYPGI